jgi:hypothetical protein
MRKQYTKLMQRQPGQVLATTPANRDEESSAASMRVEPQVAWPLRNAISHSTTAVQRQQLVLRLQRQWGNHRVARILEAERSATSGRVPSIIRQADSMPPEETVEPIPPVSITGEPHEVVAYARAPNVRLRGVTRAKFDGGKSRTENLVTEPGSGCRGCRGKNCVHVTGTVITEYRVTTTVTLPRAANIRGLTRCQRERVQDAINNILAPHEQEHVDAFETYNGTTEQPFDLNLCRGQLPRAVKKMVRDEERPRRAAAQAQSDALDPFNFDVDLDCTD